MRFRRAEQRDIPAVVDLSGRVQERLTASGSLQEFGPIPAETVSAHVGARTAFVLEDDAALTGGVFVEPCVSPVTAGLPEMLDRWGLDVSDSGLWFLQKLMVAPAAQGKMIGRVLLDDALNHVADRGAGQVVLDCWAGNAKLREFYTNAGFRLHGVFPEKDYEVAVFIRNLRRQTGSS
ncbi:MAG: GNAT family N-acetyltransferase [Dehalococcoidia bacterium]